MESKKVVIIGSGPAGYTAAIYCARAQLEPVLFEGFFSGVSGGQLMMTTEVENFPGFAQGITGPDLMQAMRDQAQRFGAILVPEDVLALELSERPFVVKTKGQSLRAHALILATGATAKRLQVPGTQDGQLWQKGVSACAVCDGAMPLFRNKPVYVIGGGDSAAEEALFLTKYASKVYVVHRRDSLRASKVMSERLVKHPKVQMVWNSEVIEALGSQVLTHLVIRNLLTGQTSTEPAAGLFFAIGHSPNTSFLNGQLELLEHGYIKLFDGSSTSLEGVFAAGDVADPIYRQAVTAAGSGCKAAMDAERWLSAQGLAD